MLASALMAIILAAAYACFRAAYSGRVLVETRADIAQNARVALGLIGADLRAAFPLSKDYPFLGMDRTLGETEADNIDFATHNHVPKAPLEGDFCEISYYLEQDRQDPASGLFSLWRRRDASPDLEPLSGGTREEIARGLTGLKFEYYDGLDWFDEWGDPEGRYLGRDTSLLPNNLLDMPDAVRVTLRFDPAGFSSRKSRTKSSGPAGRSDSGATATAPEPPMVFQTVHRLNLAPISITRATSGTDAAATGPSEGAD
jgi:hypothetical protein